MHSRVAPFSEQIVYWTRTRIRNASGKNGLVYTPTSAPYNFLKHLTNDCFSILNWLYRQNKNLRLWTAVAIFVRKFTALLHSSVQQKSTSNLEWRQETNTAHKSQKGFVDGIVEDTINVQQRFRRKSKRKATKHLCWWDYFCSTNLLKEFAQHILYSSFL